MQAGLKLREPIQEKNVVVVTKLLERKIQAQLVYQVKELYNKPGVESRPSPKKTSFPKDGWTSHSKTSPKMVPIWTEGRTQEEYN